MTAAERDGAFAAIDPWRDDKNVRRVPRTLAEAFPDERAHAIDAPHRFDVTRAGHRFLARFCAIGLVLSVLLLWAA